VLLHRPTDIVYKVANGDVDLGITGLDLVREYGADEPNIVVADAHLGFGRSDLIMAVPEAWVDVQSWADLADLAAEYAAAGQQLRIATKYRNLVRSFCYQRGVNVFALIDSQGATEAAPALGYADMIADITETGTTLRENRLKIVAGTRILRSQACLIAGRRALRQDRTKLEVTRTVLELVEARRKARGQAQVIANVPGLSAAAVAERMMESPDLRGLQGPTIASVYSAPGAVARPPQDWFAVSIIVQGDRVLAAVEQLRTIGSTGIVVLPLQYAFADQSEAVRNLVQELEQ
jgi:ATP phosphoribosyltransferase